MRASRSTTSNTFQLLASIWVPLYTIDAPISMIYAPSSPLPSFSSTCPIKEPPTESTATSSIPSSNQRAHKQRKADTEAAIRGAKLFLHENVREDWTWPSQSSQTPSTRCALLETQWHERASDSSSCPSPTLGGHDLPPPTDPYRFDSPDSLLDVKRDKKRKRRHALQEEMNYNAGLCIFMRRRDAWTGAIPMPQSPLDSAVESEASESIAIHSGSEDIDLLSPLTSTSQLSTNSKNEATNIPSDPGRASVFPKEEELAHISQSVLIPLPPPLLPHSNPVRAGISPATYPSIYSKIVVQGLSPTVPVNLKDVVGAIVDGWKRDGEWPPRDSEGRAYQAKQVAAQVHSNFGDSMGKTLAKRGVGKVKRALGIDKDNENEEG